MEQSVVISGITLLDAEGDGRASISEIYYYLLMVIRKVETFKDYSSEDKH